MSTGNPPRISFWTAAPEAAPDEIKGVTCYFHPERLEWSITKHRTYVTAHGPATRVAHRQGATYWCVAGRRPDALPLWLHLPHSAISMALAAVNNLTDHLASGADS